MAKYLFVYHGGKESETEEELAEALDAWGNWFGSMGAAVIDGGNPVGESSTVNPDGEVINWTIVPSTNVGIRVPKAAQKPSATA